mgnify:FL=1
MILKIYSNKTNELFFELPITKELLTNYDLDVHSDDFTELFETELLSDILEENNIQSSLTHYELS